MMDRSRRQATTHSLLAARRGQAPLGHSRTTWAGLLIAGLAIALSACGTGRVAGSSAQIAGNWQFTMTTTGDSFAASPLAGGFLLQKNGSFTGQIAFSLALASNGGTICNSGTATVTGTVSGQTVSLTAMVGTLDANGNPATQTLTLSGGGLSADRSSIQNGTYSMTAGYALVNGQLLSCGTAQDSGSWSAVSVPPLAGGFQGFFHSTTGTLANQDFPVSGTLTQGENLGDSSASITGSIVFQDPVSLLNNYPCLTKATVNGTISGNTVLLEIFSTSGSAVGQIGQTPGAGSGPTPVTFDKTQNGYVLHNLQGAPAGGSGGGYQVATKSCPNGDSGNLCLAVGSATSCTQPITLIPFSLQFAPQLLGSVTTQTITLANTSNTQLTGLGLALAENDSGLFYGPPTFGGDFNGVAHFSQQNTCAPQGTFNLAAGASCTITVSFAPQESCPWLPQPSSGNPPIDGFPPAQCPINLNATLTVTVPSGGADADNQFTVPITGSGLSQIVPSVPELDFGAEAVGEASPPQTLTFINQSPNLVAILPAAAPCSYSIGPLGPAQPRPPLGQIGGIQLAETASIGLNNSGPIANDVVLAPPLVNAPTVQYFCETDPPVSKGGSGRPNFQIADGCSGQTLAPFGQAGDSCSLQITFAPQPGTWPHIPVTAVSGLDDFLELNTTWCGDATNPPEANCEIDSGRFPVEIKTTAPSPLRMSPGAGLDFGAVTKGQLSSPLTITLFNDPVDPNTATVSFTSKLVTGDYLERDNCPPALAANQSCTITVNFTPNVVGLDPGKITLTYNTPNQVGLVQTIFMRGTGQ